jgi:ribosomal protein S13
MDSLLVRHNIATIKTENIESTMLKIINIMKQYYKHPPIGTGLSSDTASALTEDDDKIEPMNASELSTLVLNKRPPKTIKSIAIACLSTINGISNNTAEAILTKCSLMEFLTNPGGYVLIGQSGRSVSANVIQNIININTNNDIAAKYIAAVDGISMKTALQIVKVARVTDFTLPILSTIQVGETKLKSLGDIKAQRILDAINYKYILE